MKGRSHDEPNRVTGEPRGKVERTAVYVEESIARTFGRCTLLCGDADCSKGCSK